MLSESLFVGFFLLTTCPVFGQETITTIVRKSTTTQTESQTAALLEKKKAEIDYCEKNLGMSFDEVDVSKIGETGAYDMRVKVITYGLIAAKYEAYGDLSKAAEYYYKDYLVESNPSKYWKSKHSWSSPGDSMPFPLFMDILKRNHEYQKMLRVYPEYFEYYFLGDRYSGSKEDKIKSLKEAMKYDSELKSSYDNFMAEWRDAKKSAKTEKPCLLDPAVENHEWFYSNKQVKVLKSLEYYFQNKVKFMIGKAVNHKDPVIAAKAKEYMESLGK